MISNKPVSSALAKDPFSVQTVTSKSSTDFTEFSIFVIRSVAAGVSETTSVSVLDDGSAVAPNPKKETINRVPKIAATLPREIFFFVTFCMVFGEIMPRKKPNKLTNKSSVKRLFI